PAAAATPFRVSTSVSPRFVYFADDVTARVSVIADRRQVDPASLRVTPAFGNWDQVAPVRTTSISSGPFVSRSWTYEIACFQATCLPNEKALTVHLPPVVVSAKRPDGSTAVAQHAWPAISVAPWYGAAGAGATPAFELDRGLPAATYRI